jgi:hypothetical protein
MISSASRPTRCVRAHIRYVSPSQNKESADAYEHTYETMEAGLFQLVGHTLRCDPPYELCAAIEEQVNQPQMRAELKQLKTTKKKKGQPPSGKEPEKKKKLSLPLAHPLCDNTTKFSKSIYKKKPHLRGKINQCAAHLTGMLLHNEFAECISIIMMISAWLSKDSVAEEDSLQVFQES